MNGSADRTMRFGPDALARSLAQLPRSETSASRFVVAWSGGADSTALLAAACELRSSRGFFLRALHVDHGLQVSSRAWARHCRRVARGLGVPLRVMRVSVRRKRGESPEAAARRARYDAFEADLRDGEVLLLAQHARDQLETLLLQLMRGSGARGLAAIPASRPLGRGYLLRPLLQFVPDELRRYLALRGLEWVEDPSNASIDADRNFLRTEVVSRLLQRWPAALRTSARSAQLLRRVDGTVSRVALRDLAAVRDGADLSLPLLRRLPRERCSAVIRVWLEQSGAQPLDSARLAQALAVLDLRDDARVEIRWTTHVLRRHQDRLQLDVASSVAASEDDELSWRWSRGRLTLPAGELRVIADRHGDLDLALLPPAFLIRRRPRGGVRDVVDVKSLLREGGVPSWNREALPFLYDPRASSADEGLLAIADLWVADSIRARPDSSRRGRFVWHAK